MPPSTRFNLLLLDEGEHLLDEYGASFHGWIPVEGAAQSSVASGGGASSSGSAAPAFTSFAYAGSVATSAPPPPPAFQLVSHKKGRLRVCTRGLFFEPEDVRVPILKLPFRAMHAGPSALTPAAALAAADPFFDPLLAAVAASNSEGCIGGGEEGGRRGNNNANNSSSNSIAGNTLVCQCSSMVEMKVANVVAPYRFRTFPEPPPRDQGAKDAAEGGGKEGSFALRPGHAAFALCLTHTSCGAVLPVVQQLWSIQQRARKAHSSFERAALEPVLSARREGPFNLSLLLDFRERPLLPVAPMAITAERIFPLVSCPGRMMVTERAVYFQPVPINNVSGSDPVACWHLQSVARVLRRTRLQRAVALELVLGGSGSGSGGLAAAASGASTLHLPLPVPAAVSALVDSSAVNAAGLKIDSGAAATVFLVFSSPAAREEVYQLILSQLRTLSGKQSMPFGSGGVGGGGRAGGGKGGPGAGTDASGGGSRGGGSGVVGGAGSFFFDDELGDPSPSLVQSVTRAWQRRTVSNYEYLAFLNVVAGRTLSDFTSAPVFPWVIADYTSRRLDLSDPATFRDLSKPIGALNPQRLAQLRERFDEMPRDVEGLDPPFLYGAHYSTPGYCLYFLVRQLPEHMLKLQSGRFDAPDRMFFDVATAWNGVVSMNMDVKELTADFYRSDGSFLLLPEAIDLGLRQNGKRVADVTLPPWAFDAGDFVAQCAEALESDYVSEHLHEWIDLVFGFKQRGPEAEKANNVFHWLTYDGAVSAAELERMGPDQRHAMQQQMAEFGQTPKQLFASPHPSRNAPPTELAATAGGLDAYQLLSARPSFRSSAPGTPVMNGRRGAFGMPAAGSDADAAGGLSPSSGPLDRSASSAFAFSPARILPGQGPVAGFTLDQSTALSTGTSSVSTTATADRARDAASSPDSPVPRHLFGLTWLPLQVSADSLADASGAANTESSAQALAYAENNGWVVHSDAISILDAWLCDTDTTALLSLREGASIVRKSIPTASLALGTVSRDGSISKLSCRIGEKVNDSESSDSQASAVRTENVHCDFSKRMSVIPSPIPQTKGTSLGSLLFLHAAISGVKNANGGFPLLHGASIEHGRLTFAACMDGFIYAVDTAYGEVVAAFRAAPPSAQPAAASSGVAHSQGHSSTSSSKVLPTVLCAASCTPPPQQQALDYFDKQKLYVLAVGATDGSVSLWSVTVSEGANGRMRTFAGGEPSLRITDCAHSVTALALTSQASSDPMKGLNAMLLASGDAQGNVRSYAVHVYFGNRKKSKRASVNHGAGLSRGSGPIAGSTEDEGSPFFVEADGLCADASLVQDCTASAVPDAHVSDDLTGITSLIWAPSTLSASASSTLGAAPPPNRALFAATVDGKLSALSSLNRAPKKDGKFKQLKLISTGAPISSLCAFSEHAVLTGDSQGTVRIWDLSPVSSDAAVIPGHDACMTTLRTDSVELHTIQPFANHASAPFSLEIPPPLPDVPAPKAKRISGLVALELPSDGIQMDGMAAAERTVLILAATTGGTIRGWVSRPAPLPALPAVVLSEQASTEDATTSTPGSDVVETTMSTLPPPLEIPNQPEDGKEQIELAGPESEFSEKLL
jgi:WD40 repeat protein